jgi:hypothetical protein
MTMTKEQIESLPRMRELADQIENHSLAIDRLMNELNERFTPPPGYQWVISLGRPHLMKQAPITHKLR